MTGIAIALLGAGLWGAADFAGGLLSRRLAVLGVVCTIEVAGLVGVTIVVLIVQPAFPATAEALSAVGAGIAGLAGLACFYRALAVGTMSIVAPISATGVVIPVVVGIAGGDRLSGLVAVGLVIAFAGVLLASREAEDAAAERGPAATRGIGLALLAAVGFGLYFTGSAAAADGGALWAGLLSRAGAVPLAFGALLATRSALPRGRDLRLLAVAGQFDVSATLLFVTAAGMTSLAVVSVIGSLYPVVTVLLARTFLAERLQRVQAIGVVVVFVGVALVSAGSA